MRRDLHGPVHFTNLKNMAKSPAHYLASLDDDSDKPQFRLGRAVHYAALGGNYVVYSGERRGKAWQDFKYEHRDVDIFTDVEIGMAQDVADLGVRRNEHARRLLAQSRHEVEIEWSYLGRKCSSRLDMLGEDFVADLKTTSCAQPVRFQRQALWYGYAAQLAFYKMAAEAAGKKPSECYIVAVETVRPYAVTVLRLTHRLVEQGERQCRLWMEQLLACEASGTWPGYCESIVQWDAEEDVELTFGDEGEAA